MKSIPTLTSATVHHFRTHAFTPALPHRLPPRHFNSSLPAITNWLRHDPTTDLPTLNAEFFAQHPDFNVPVEITQITPPRNGTTTTFDRTDLPFSSFLHLTSPSLSSKTSTPNLYVAQHSLASLPITLQSCLPTPSIVHQAGKGDIYDSSLWLGLAPTYTPLHKDPNPNLFVQLAGQKAVRVFPPEFGRALFEEAQRRLGGGASADFRGEEMMQGTEREVLEGMVWGAESEEQVEEMGMEAELQSGDGVFIPKGWWHSIKGMGEGMNGSVNWWFR